MRIGIIGHGFVGKAVEYGFSNNDIMIYDPKYGHTEDVFKSWQHEKIDAIFICVPTPMQDDGDINSSIIEDVYQKLFEYFPDTLLVIKSTITPKVIKKLSKINNNKNLVYNPEFLTEKSACTDFINPKFHVYGGQFPACKQLESLYETYSLCSPCPTFIVSIKEASVIKYTINTFLATKVTFFNQLHKLCEKDNALNFNAIAKVVGEDDRVGHSHTKVPGPDGKKGFGGSCFPKDVYAFYKQNPEMTLLKEVIDVNNSLRVSYNLDAREKDQNIKFNHKTKE